MTLSLKCCAISALLATPLLQAEWFRVVDFEEDGYFVTDDESDLMNQGWIFQDWDYVGRPDCDGTIDCTGVREIVPAPYGGNGKAISIRALDATVSGVANARSVSAISFPDGVEIPSGGVGTLYFRFAFENYQVAHHFGLTTRTEAVSGSELPHHEYSDLGPGLQVSLHQASTRNSIAVWDAYTTSFWADATLDEDLKLEAGVWYEIWMHVHNATVADGGGYWDLYIRGGNFGDAEPMHLENIYIDDLTDWGFRDKQDAALKRFVSVANGNSGTSDSGVTGDAIYFDDMYLAPGELVLTSPEVGGGENWAGLTVTDGWVFTSEHYLGWAYVGHDPWVYSLDLGAYVHLPESYYSPTGSWAYFPDFGAINAEKTPWLISTSLDTWIYAPGHTAGTTSGWAYVLNTGAGS